MKGFVPEINGIRAYAVVCVVLFHAFPKFVSGGFIGVDIFFVVSGYVIARAYITRLLSTDLTLRQFLLRRVRRLAPAYGLMMIAITPLAVLILDPVLLKSFGLSLVSQPFYLQNMVFWNQGEYFQDGKSIPFLHTWSLAVEEQFYLMFVLLVVLTRKWPKSIEPILVIVFIASLVSAYIMTFVTIRTSFYWFPFRAWEFVAGILAYQLSRRINLRQGTLLDQLIAVGALSGLLVSTMAYDESSVIPGEPSLLAVISTALLLVIFERRSLPSFGLLRLGFIQYTGKISYSFYLWHWPLLSIAVIAKGTPLNGLEAVALVVLAYGISMLSYRFVESPVRERYLVSQNRDLLAAFGALSLIVAVSGFFLVKTNGVLFCYQEPLSTLYATAQQDSIGRCSRLWRMANPRREFCPINSTNMATSPSVLILGDSHALRFVSELGRIGNTLGVNVYLATRVCDFDEYGWRRICSVDVLNRLVEQAKDAGVRRVLLISKWPNNGPRTDGFERNLERLMASDIDVYISEVVPNDPLFNPYLRAEKIKAGQTQFQEYPLERYELDTLAQRNFFQSIKQEYGARIQILRPASILCKTGTCSFSTNGLPNYVDNNHLSMAGVERLLPVYRKALEFAQ